MEQFLWKYARTRWSIRRVKSDNLRPPSLERAFQNPLRVCQDSLIRAGA
jgi:hypothetical protein